MAIGIPPRSGVPHLSPASVEKRAGADSEELRVNNWLTPWDGEDQLDAGLSGCPTRGPRSIPPLPTPRRNRFASPSVTTRPTHPTGTPTSEGCVRDLGDVGGHLTDVTVAHAKYRGGSRPPPVRSSRASCQ